MEYRWIEDVKEFQKISKEWDRAVICSGEDLPFLLSDFLITWWKHYFRDYLKLRIFVVYRHGVLIGGLPLCQNRRGYLEYPGRIAANYTEFFSSEDKQFIWDVFLRAINELDDWRGIYLNRIRKSSVDMDILKAAASRYAKEIFLDVHKYGLSYLIDIPKSFPEYISCLPKKLRYYIRRSEKGFSELGKISLYSLNDRGNIGEVADTYIKLSRKTFNDRHKDSAFDDARFCEFFKELLVKFRLAGYLDANVLKLNDRAIAIHFGYSIRNNLNYVFTTFETDFSLLNPGHLLIYKLLELGVIRKNVLFDLYTGDHLYKRQWSNRQEEVVTIEMRPRNVESALRRLVSIKIRRHLFTDKVKKAVGFSPALLKAAKKIKRSIGR